MDSIVQVVKFPQKRLFGSVQVSLKRHIEFADLDFSRILDRPLEDLLGRDILDFVAHSDRPATRERFAKLVESGQAYTALKRFERSFDKAPVPVLSHACLLRDPAGGAVGVVIVEQVLTEIGAERVRPVIGS